MSQQVTAPMSGYGPAARDVVSTLTYGSCRQVRLSAWPSAVPWARRVLRHMLDEWQLDSLSDPALLLVSELVTNAVKASASPTGPDQSRPMIGLTLQLTDAGLLVEVSDHSPGVPVLQEADLTGQRGHGLVLVDFLADSWGHRAAADGKVVWCTVGIPGREQAPQRSETESALSRVDQAA